MKKIFKALGITALAAAVIPVRVRKHEGTGKITLQSLLLSMDIRTRKHDDDTTAKVGINLGEGLITGAVLASREEANLFTNDPEEAVILEPGDPDFDAPFEAGEPAETAEAEAPAEVLPEEPEV